MTQQALPKEILDLHLRLDALERKIGKASIVSVPNQNLSETSDVTFNSILVGLRGAWTPTFSGSTTAGVFTYTLQVGQYFVLSNNILLYGQIGISAIGTPPTGSMRIGGLPFMSNATHIGSLTFSRISNINYTAAALQLTALVNTNGQIASLWETFDNGGVVAYPAANFTNAAAQIFFTGMYTGA